MFQLNFQWESNHAPENMGVNKEFYLLSSKDQLLATLDSISANGTSGWRRKDNGYYYHDEKDDFSLVVFTDSVFNQENVVSGGFSYSDTNKWMKVSKQIHSPLYLGDAK